MLLLCHRERLILTRWNICSGSSNFFGLLAQLMTDIYEIQKKEKKRGYQEASLNFLRNKLRDQFFLRLESSDDPTNIGEWGTDWLRWWTSLLCFRFLTELLEKFPNSRSQIFLDLAFYYRFLATLYEGLYWHSQMNFDSIYAEKMLQIM